MKIITTSDWHLGNLFHGNDRLSEHKHFLAWLLACLEEEQPDALLVAGDVFDNGNPSAAAQSVYYEFLADVTKACPNMRIIITAGNHDSANRLEAPRVLLARHRVEVRGNVHRVWNPETESWQTDMEDLMIPVIGRDGDRMVVLAVPYLRSDVVQNISYSEGVNHFLRSLTERARELYPEFPLVMMAHMYAKGAEIATRDASEKIVIGGQEEVSLEEGVHPDYLTCGHIHKRQRVWGTDWARYTGSVLPMSFAEKDYRHGVDLVLLEEGKLSVEQKVYIPQHQLCVLPEDDTGLTPKKLAKLIHQRLKVRTDGKLSDNYDYVMLKVKQDKVNNDDIKALENLVNTKDAVLCKIQKIVPQLNLSTINEGEKLASIDDILNRDPMDTLREAFAIRHNVEMSEQQEALLQDLLNGIKNETDD